jgi:Chlorophyll A-B binding protein
VQLRLPDPSAAECADARKLPGITAPTGYFDPLGLAQGTTPEQVKRYGESELTHGRICMLAALGFLAGEQVQDKTLFYNWDGQIQGACRRANRLLARCPADAVYAVMPGSAGWLAARCPMSHVQRATAHHNALRRVCACSTQPRRVTRCPPRPAGSAIVHFQQTHQGFWEPLVLVIGICEAYRIAVGWANPAEKGAFTLRDDYEPGKLGCAPACCHQRSFGGDV